MNSKNYKFKLVGNSLHNIIIASRLSKFLPQEEIFKPEMSGFEFWFIRKYAYHYQSLDDESGPHSALTLPETHYVFKVLYLALKNDHVLFSYEVNKFLEYMNEEKEFIEYYRWELENLMRNLVQDHNQIGMLLNKNLHADCEFMSFLETYMGKKINISESISNENCLDSIKVIEATKIWSKIPGIDSALRSNQKKKISEDGLSLIFSKVKKILSSLH